MHWRSHSPQPPGKRWPCAVLALSHRTAWRGAPQWAAVPPHSGMLPLKSNRKTIYEKGLDFLLVCFFDFLAGLPRSPWTQGPTHPGTAEWQALHILACEYTEFCLCHTQYSLPSKQLPSVFKTIQSVIHSWELVQTADGGKRIFQKTLLPVTFFKSISELTQAKLYNQ